MKPRKSMLLMVRHQIYPIQAIHGTLYLLMMQRGSLLLVLLTPMFLFAQEMILNGGEVSILNGTTVQMIGPLNWTITGSAAVVNHGHLHLREGARLSEDPGAAITGTGTEHAFIDVPVQLDAFQPGGL